MKNIAIILFGITVLLLQGCNPSKSNFKVSKGEPVILKEKSFTFLGKPSFFLPYKDSLAFLANKNDLVSYDLENGDLLRKIDSLNIDVLDSLVEKYYPNEDFIPGWEGEKYQVSGLRVLNDTTLKVYIRCLKRFKGSIGEYEDAFIIKPTAYILDYSLVTGEVLDAYIVRYDQFFDSFNMVLSPRAGFALYENKFFTLMYGSSYAKAKKNGEFAVFSSGDDQYEFEDVLFSGVLPKDTTFLQKDGYYKRRFAVKETGQNQITFFSYPYLILYNPNNQNYTLKKIGSKDDKAYSNKLNFDISKAGSSFITATYGKGQVVIEAIANGNEDFRKKGKAVIDVEGLINCAIVDNHIYCLVKKGKHFKIQKFTVNV